MKSANNDNFLSPLAHLGTADPRSSSTQSLVPSEADADSLAHDPRRRLLLVYIHGFYGNNQSFRSFPAHVHAYLKDALAETHVIHSKIYPRYKTYHAVKVGAQNFSEWLAPHEDTETDVVLVGHSMGGILAAEVVLMPNPDPFQPHLYKHRILGIIAMDTPFIGLHPRIIPTGIASLFRRDEPSAQQDQNPSQSTFTPTPENQDHSQAAIPQEQGVSLGHSAPNSLDLSLPQTVSAPELSHESSTFILDQKQALASSPNPDAKLPPNSSPNLAPSAPAEPSSRPRTPSDPPPPYPHPSPEPSDPTFDPPFHNDIVLRDRSRLTSLAHFAQKHFSEGIVSAAGRHVLSHMEYAACLADYRELHTRYVDVRALEDVDPLKGLEEWGADTADGPSFRARAARVRFVNYYTAATGRPKKEKEKKKKEGTEESADAGPPALSVEVSSAASIASHDSQAPSTQAASFDGNSAVSVASYDPGLSAAHSDSSLPPPPAPAPAPVPASSGRKEAFHSAYDQALKASRRKLLKTGLKLLEKRSSSSSSSHQDPPNSSLYLSSHSTTTERQRLPPSTSADPMPARMRKFCATPKMANGVDETWVSVPMRDIDEVDAHVSMFLDDGKHYGGLVVDVGKRVVEWVKGDELRRVAEMAVQ